MTTTTRPSSGPAPATTTTAADRRLTPRERAVLACVCACTVLVIGFVAAINLAVPQLAASGLHPSSSQLLWIVDAYVVLFACLVIPAGALGDRLGRKGVLVAGLVVFAVGALVSTCAADVPVMLIGRAVTGLGAAAVLPNSLAVLVHAVRPERRAHAIAVWAAMSGIGGVIGNVGGGALLSIGSWRWLFGPVVPVALGCALWVALAAPRTDRHRRNPDVASAVLLTLATVALLLGIVEGPERGWGATVVVAAFVVSVVLFVAWVLRGLRSATPMLDPRLFRVPAVRAASLGMTVAFFGMFGFFYLNASLLQYGRGLSVLMTGVAIIPLTVPMLVVARVVPRLAARVGDRAVLVAAFVLVGAGLFGLGTAVRAPYPVYAVGLVVVGVGIALALPTLTIAISAALPREQAGVAGGLQSTTREFGSALGVAVVGTLLTAQFAGRLHGVLHGEAARTVAGALRAAPSRHGDIVAAYTGAARSALHEVAVLVLVVGALVVVDLAVFASARRETEHRPGHPRQ